MVQVDEEIPGHVGWEGKDWLKYGEVERCWWLVERAPLQKGAPFARRARPCGRGCALVAYLIGRGSSPSKRFGDFLLFFHAAKS
jgi:hypothetical protein